MALRGQNSRYPYNEVPTWYANNKLYVGSMVRNNYSARTSRRMHDGLVLATNYGLDTQADDVNSSMYSSPYYINGRFTTTNTYTQRGNSASVQGIERLASYGDEVRDFSNADAVTTIKLWQGKQIKFELDYDGKLVGNTITLRNTQGSTGILSMYFSLTDGGTPVYETAIDLCKVSEDNFEHLKVYSIDPIEAKKTPKGKLYVRMEIWNEISMERSQNPFNTGKYIEIKATGVSGHYEAVTKLGAKNEPVLEKYEYVHKPNRPCIGLIYNNWDTVPVYRAELDTHGATVYSNGYRYDIFCCKNDTEAKVLIYDNAMKKFLPDSQVNIAVDSRLEQLNFVQAGEYCYYVDGYSALQKFKIGEWRSVAFSVSTTNTAVATVDFAKFAKTQTDSGEFVFNYHNGKWYLNAKEVNLADYGISISGDYTEGGFITVTYSATKDNIEGSVSAVYNDNRPVLGASIIHLQENRIYLAGFRYDPNLVQFSEIDSGGANFDSYPYRFYSPDVSPKESSDNPITAILGQQSDTFLIMGRRFYSTFSAASSSYGKTYTPENSYPSQVASYIDSSGVATPGDVVNYKGVLYSFDPDEGIRRYSGGIWQKIPASIDSYYERVDMTKRRMLWGYGNKLYMFYTDKVDGQHKALIWDQDMNYQQYPWFQDTDMPVADIRWGDDYDLIACHSDYPCVMAVYKEDTWRRFDTPITFERWTKNIPTPGNASDMILKTAYVKVLANANRWWWVGLSWDKPALEQHRGKTLTYRFPVWDTVQDDVPVESAFNENDVYTEDSLSNLAIGLMKKQAMAIRIKVKCRTFRAQASLVSEMIEVQAHQYK